LQGKWGRGPKYQELVGKTRTGEVLHVEGQGKEKRVCIIPDDRTISRQIDRERAAKTRKGDFRLGNEVVIKRGKRGDRKDGCPDRRKLNQGPAMSGRVPPKKGTDSQLREFWQFLVRGASIS